MDEMLIVAKAARRGVSRALVSVDIPFGPVQEGDASAVRAAVRMAKEGGADLVKIDGATDFPSAVYAVARAGVPVWAQFGITPQTALRHDGDRLPDDAAVELVAQARRLEDAGAALLDFTHSGPVAGAAVTEAVGIPVIGGMGGGPWLDGRVRLAHRATGYAASTLDDEPDSYVHVARATMDAFTSLAGDVRAGRPIKGDAR
jgi:3-methyl-2-oxobutanoate hydroxymethyltransferase